MGFNPSLHALRGVASTAVLIFHWYQFFPAAADAIRPAMFAGTILDPTIYIGFGWMGVPLFFVLSGYLLGGQVIHAQLDARFLKRFWLRRFLRIYPAVWAELLILLLVGTFVIGLISTQGMASLPLQFLLWINLPPFMAEPINLVWWTLPVELSFYLLLPLLGVLARHVSWSRLLVVALMITLGWRAAWFLSTDTENYLKILPILDSLPGVLLTFMLGFSMNFLPGQLSILQRRWGVVISLITLLMLMQWQLTLNDVYWTGHWILVIWPPMIALPIAGLVYFLRDPSPEWQWLQQRWLVWLGHVSFGIYLWHFQVMRVLVLLYPDLWDTPATSLVALLISLPVTLSLATLSYYVIEKPLMGWGKKYA
ncbi:MAG: acyltransferase [Luminiphilus sp.]|nr:acyltransferase [Luminiphilus sp.]